LMAPTNIAEPHPLLRFPTLYVVDVPDDIKWPHLIDVFKPCGFVRSGGRSTSHYGRAKWAVTFTDVFHGLYYIFIPLMPILPN
jgi:hypothetical protein